MFRVIVTVSKEKRVSKAKKETKERRERKNRKKWTQGRNERERAEGCKL